MKAKNRLLIGGIAAITLILALVACSITPQEAETPTLRSEAQPVNSASSTVEGDESQTPTSVSVPEEAELLEIRLPAVLADTQMEYSGMAWFGDTLVLLPQYPDRVQQESEGALYSINKEALIAYIENPTEEPIAANSVRFDDAGLSESLKGFEGFESIAFYEDLVFLTIETRPGMEMMGYLVSGTVSGELESITLDPDSLVALKPQAAFSNASDEAISFFGDTLLTFFEDNGASQNANPFARQFGLGGEELTALTMPHIEFRVTDATDVEADGSFWVINYFYPGDKHLRASADPIADLYGEGLTHSQSERVERLVQLRVTDASIQMVDTAPIQFQLLDDGDSRNWEGLVKLDDIGFLLVTDKFPRTILAFCEATGP